ncbi:MAG: FKBP-type peptidyl-prolyl cis-trans isomerase [bacterium]|nr:FKBP-type peptidyl-prolyl cis-trans isomerase [bacterium]
MRIAGLLAVAALVFVAVGCKKTSPEEQAEIDDQLIQDYLIENGLVAQKDPSGLYYIIEQQGTGPECNSNSDVRVAYTGYFLDGEIFDGSSAQGITFNLGGVIDGWRIGIPYFKEGGSGKLLIPSALGYGPSGGGSIPPNAVLIFDIELIEVL